MVRSIDWISTDPGSGPLNIPRLSISQFNNQAEEQITRIKEVTQNLERLCLPFDNKGTILPIACKEAVSALSQLRECVGHFCVLLDETARLPLIFTALRHDILYRLYFIIDQARRLEYLIDSYRPICMSPTQGPHRKLIYDGFQNIFQQISETAQQLKYQSQKARFQEQRLISIYEEA